MYMYMCMYILIDCSRLNIEFEIGIGLRIEHQSQPFVYVVYNGAWTSELEMFLIFEHRIHNGIYCLQLNTGFEMGDVA